MKFKKLFSILISICILFSTFVFSQTAVNAATFNNINQSSVFVKQQVKGTCTLASCVMLVRRASMMNGNANWMSITESSMKSTAWVTNIGLLWSFTYSGISVGHNTLPGGTANKSTLIKLLASHPEGIVAYNGGNANQRHAIILTDYTNGIFYCADPAGSSSGRVPLNSSTIKGANQDEKLGNFNAYWYVTAPTVTLSPLDHPHSYTLVYTEQQHPHRNVYKCSCGASYINTETANFSDSCDTCKKPVISDGWYKIALTQSPDYAIYVSDGSAKDGENVQLLKYNKNYNEQKMYFRYIGDGYYNIQFHHSKKMLDVKGGIGVTKANVQQWNANGSDAQKWALISDGNGSYYLKSKAGNVFLDLYGKKLADGTNIWVYTPNYSSAQKWSLVPVSKRIKYYANGGKKVVNKVTSNITGVNIYRAQDKMVVYNKAGCTTGTNIYGVEALVDANNKVTEIRPYGTGNAAIPANGGFVLSGHNQMRYWINNNVKVGNFVTYNSQTNKVNVYKDYNSFRLDNTYVLDNQKVGALPTVTKAGSQFLGWYTSKTAGKLVTSETIYPNTKLYAHWAASHNHKIVIKNKKNATYFDNGYSGDKYCSICNLLIAKGKATSKLALKKPSVSIKTAKRNLIVKYSSVKNASGYQIRYKIGKKTITKTYRNKHSAIRVINKLKKGRYSVQVRAFIKKSNKRAFGEWSKAKKTKVK